MFRKNLFIVCILFVFGLFGLSYVFGYSAELKFNVPNANVHLYCTGEYPVIHVMVSGDLYNGYTAYIPWVSTLNYINVVDTNISSDFTSKSAVASMRGDCPGVYCMKFLGSKGISPMLNGLRTGGTFTLQNSGYFRNQIISFTGGYTDTQNHSLSKVVSGTDTYDIFNFGLTLYALNISGTLGPCNADSHSPVFAFTGGFVPHLGSANTIDNYTGALFNNKVYIFDLYDPGSTDRGFEHGGFTDTWSPDRDNGSGYVQTVLNGSGINLATFVFEVGVEDSPNSAGTFNVVTLTGTLNYTGGSAIPGSVSGLWFYPYDFTWNRWNRNYTGYAETGILSANETWDVLDNQLLFGNQPEEEVIMTGYVYDRSNPAKISNVFTRHFNYGAIPWSSNQASGELKTGCGPAGSTSIDITAPGADSGAYIVKYNDGYVLQPFKVYLQDDRAGIDTGTITVYLSGMQGDSWTGITLTVSSSEITITPFAWAGPIDVMTTRGVNEDIYNTTNQNRNYETLIDYTGKRDPETPIQVSINYKDLVVRTGTQVTCSYVNSYAPYANNWTGGVHLQRRPYASGGKLSGFVIKVEDEWAGVDSGTITLTISGSEVTDMPNRITSAKLISLDWAALSGWLTKYTTHTGTIDGGQQYNYTITVPYNADRAGYFSPEHPIEIAITYTDFAGHIQTATKQYSNLDTVGSYGTLYNNNQHVTSYINTGYLLINISENPFLTVFGSTINEISTPAERFDAFPIRTFANGYTGGISQYSGMQFGIFDYRAGVDGKYNFVVITGSRRGSLATYVFATDDSTGRNRTDRTNCTLANNCMTGTMTKVAVQVTGYDTSNPQHPTMVRSTGYTFQISSGHNIYFDYGIYGNPSNYTINVYLSDMRPDVPNTDIRVFSTGMDSLACLFLDRCSHDMLTFVWGAGLTGDTITANPLTGYIDNPFTGFRVNIVGSGVVINTGTSTVYCANSEGLIDSPVALDFTKAPNLTGASIGSYQSPVLYVADGLFELSGSDLIVR